MRKIKSILLAILVILSPIILCACNTKDTNNLQRDDFVGIAIYQNSTQNTKYNTIKDKPSLINNIISTEDNKIKYSEEIEFLFYIYNQSKITKSIKDEDFISNTKRSKCIAENNSFEISIERLFESTDILLYFIYKNNDGYYMVYQNEIKNINEENKTITLDLASNDFEKIIINLKINLSISETYTK